MLCRIRLEFVDYGDSLGSCCGWENQLLQALLESCWAKATIGSFEDRVDAVPQPAVFADIMTCKNGRTDVKDEFLWNKITIHVSC